VTALPTYLPTYLTTKLKYLTTYHRALLEKLTVPHLKFPTSYGTQTFTAIRLSEYHINCAGVMLYSLCGTQRFIAIRL